MALRNARRQISCARILGAGAIKRSIGQICARRRTSVVRERRLVRYVVHLRLDNRPKRVSERAGFDLRSFRAASADGCGHALSGHRRQSATLWRFRVGDRFCLRVAGGLDTCGRAGRAAATFSASPAWVSVSSGCTVILYNLAMRYTTAARASFALSTLRRQAMLVGGLLGVERLTARKSVGVVIAVLGVFAALATDLAAAPPGAWRGEPIDRRRCSVHARSTTSGRGQSSNGRARSDFSASGWVVALIALVALGGSTNRASGARRLRHAATDRRDPSRRVWRARSRSRSGSRPCSGRHRRAWRARSPSIRSPPPSSPARWSANRSRPI